MKPSWSSLLQDHHAKRLTTCMLASIGRPSMQCLLCHLRTSRVYQVLHHIGWLIGARVNHHKERMDGGWTRNIKDGRGSSRRSNTRVWRSAATLVSSSLVLSCLFASCALSLLRFLSLVFISGRGEFCFGDSSDGARSSSEEAGWRYQGEEEGADLHHRLRKTCGRQDHGHHLFREVFAGSHQGRGEGRCVGGHRYHHQGEK